MRLKIPCPEGREVSNTSCPTQQAFDFTAIAARAAAVVEGLGLATEARSRHKSTNHRPTGVPLPVGRRWRADRHAQVEVVCLQCNAKVLRASRGKRPPQKFCGNECAAAHAKATGKFKGERNPRFAGWKSKNKVAYRERFQAKYPEKAAAHRAVQNAVDRGDLVRLPCEVCGDPKAQAHHDSYLPEHRLDVRWLCRTHHRQWHDEHGEPMGHHRVLP